MERPRRLSAARATEIRRRISRPPAHWSLLAFVACVLLLLLLVYGLAGESVGHSGTPVGNEDSPLTGSQPLLTAQGGQLRSRKLPAKRVALTFDDGPDPVWTRRIARELRRLRAPATFFVIGSQVVRHPEVVRELWRQGFELGNHTFTHADVFGMPGPLRRLQIDATDNAIAGATGIRARLFRPPYSSVPEAITRPEESVLTGIARDGYVVVLSDRDGQDWHPSRSPATIARSAVGRARGASVILLHDGGGDRARTLAALPRIVRRLRAEGYRLVEVSRLVALRRAAVDFPTTGWPRLRGRLLIASLTAARWITAALTLMLAPIALLILLRAAFVVALAHRHARRRRALPTGTSQPPLGLDRGTGLQRGGGHRARGEVVRRERLPRAGGDRGGRRLRRRHGGRGRGDRPRAGAGHPPTQQREVGGAEPRHRGVAQRGHRDGRRRYGLRDGLAASSGGAAVSVRGGGGVREHKGRQPPGAAGPLAAHRVRARLQPRPAAVRRAALPAHRAGRDRRVPARRPGGCRRGPGRHAGRGHRPHARHRARRLGGRLRGGGPSLDRGARHAGGAVAAALPLVLRNDAGDLEAQGRDLAEGGEADRPARHSLPGAVPDPAAGAGTAG